MAAERTCRVAKIENLRADTIRLTLEVGDLVRTGGVRPGQFFHLCCGEEHFLRRPISVAVAWAGEPEDLAALVFEVKGAGTRWLSRRKAGEEVKVLGALGKGFSMAAEGRYLLAGGGIGCAPLLFCAAAGGGETRAVLGFRSGERVILQEEFASRGCRVDLCTDDGSAGKKGFVHRYVEEILAKDKDFTAILACGPRPMLRGVAAVAETYGVPCQVSMEERMACGVGACLGCGVEMGDGTIKRVCRDGPVFSAGEVKWDG